RRARERPARTGGAHPHRVRNPRPPVRSTEATHAHAPAGRQRDRLQEPSVPPDRPARTGRIRPPPALRRRPARTVGGPRRGRPGGPAQGRTRPRRNSPHLALRTALPGTDPP